MILGDILLSTLLQLCAPNVDRTTMTSVIMVESGAWPWTIGDNSSKPHRGYHEKTYGDAVARAHELMDQGHNLDLGLAQLNTSNLRGLGLSVEQALDPCVNVRSGAHILSNSYTWASDVYGPGQIALRHAFRAYNTGSLTRGGEYEQKIIDMATSLGFMRSQPEQDRAMARTAGVRIVYAAQPETTARPSAAPQAIMTDAYSATARAALHAQPTPPPVYFPGQRNQ